MRIERILNALFKCEEINGRGHCPTYLYRWTIFQPKRPLSVWRGFGVYLHHFVDDDWSLDMHDHPKRFISIGLSGSYIEHTPPPSQCDGEPFIYPCGCSRLKVSAGLCDSYSERQRTYRAPWIRTFSAEHTHRLTMPRRRDGSIAGDCWTLVIVLWHVREWGFWNRGTWIHWRNYVSGAFATSRKSCP